jgi:sec-independent protein translocase protein TatC
MGFVLASLILFLFGCVIAFFTLGPALEFMISWAGQDVEPTFQVQAYIRLIGLMCLAFGVGFIIPVLLVFLELIRVITPRQLLHFWRYALVLIFFVAAVITPSGDPISLIALAVEARRTRPLANATFRNAISRKSPRWDPGPNGVSRLRRLDQCLSSSLS